MKHLNLILAGIIVVSLIACGKNSPNSNLVSPGMSGASPGGTIDGGGGNSLNGKMLESYIVNPQDLSGYELIKPLLTKLEKSLIEVSQISKEEFSYYSPIAYILKSKPWYFVPTSIASLSNDRIGVPFVNGTEQVALQTFDSIWIDKTTFEKMDVEEQAKLILHEIFMGLKILRIDSTEKFLNALSYHNPKLEVELLGGFNDSVVQEPREDLNITNQDVDDVRVLTSRIWKLMTNKNEQFDLGDYARMMVKYNFDRKFQFKDTQEHLSVYGSVSGPRVSIDTVISNINQYSGFLWNHSTHGGVITKNSAGEDIIKSESSCVVSAEKISEKQIAVIFNLKAPSQNTVVRTSTYVFEIPENLRYDLSAYTWYDDRKLPGISLVGKGPTPETAHTVEMLFEGKQLAQIRFAAKVIRAYEDEYGRLRVGTEVSHEGKIDQGILCVNQSEVVLPKSETK